MRYIVSVIILSVLFLTSLQAQACTMEKILTFGADNKTSFKIGESSLTSYGTFIPAFRLANGCHYLDKAAQNAVTVVITKKGNQIIIDGMTEDQYDGSKDLFQVWPELNVTLPYTLQVHNEVGRVRMDGFSAPQNCVSGGLGYIDNYILIEEGSNNTLRVSYDTP